MDNEGGVKQEDSRQVPTPPAPQPDISKRKSWKSESEERMISASSTLADNSVETINGLQKSADLLLANYQEDPFYASIQLKIISSLFLQRGRLDEARETLEHLLKLDSGAPKSGAQARWADLNNLSVLEVTSAERSTCSEKRKLHFDRGLKSEKQADEEFNRLPFELRKKLQRLRDLNSTTALLMRHFDE